MGSCTSSLGCVPHRYHVYQQLTRVFLQLDFDTQSELVNRCVFYTDLDSQLREYYFAQRVHESGFPQGFTSLEYIGTRRVTCTRGFTIL